jgi:hypothetical protein
MEPNADQNCNIFPHEACVCEDGKVLKDGICVLPEECTEECNLVQMLMSIRFANTPKIA